MMKFTSLRLSPLLLVAVLAGCSGATNVSGINDPYEETNRSWYNASVALDRGVVKPAATAYGTVVPDPVRKGLSNVSDTLSIPGTVVNDVLQVQLGDAAHNTARFLVNATIGIAGLFDPATGMGLEARDSDFGETLHRWGVGEGAYVVLPLYGPSTERDMVGLIVDTALDPIGHVFGARENGYKTGVKVADRLDTRYRYSDLFDSVLYDSADGYAQMRLSYLDSRRFELGTPIVAGDSAGDDAAAYDIYEDFYE
jgi:phospholipid-binding lipoprotein MlaA